MPRILPLTLVLAMVIAAAPAVRAQGGDPERAANRDRLGLLLIREGGRDDIRIAFTRARTNEWNFSGRRTAGMIHVDELEVVASVGDNSNLNILAYPRYRGGYINVDKVADRAGFMRELLAMNYRNYLDWGVDADGDVFAAFTFGLESGFPDAAIVMALRSIEATDRFVGELRPFIDGSNPK